MVLCHYFQRQRKRGARREGTQKDLLVKSTVFGEWGDDPLDPPLLTETPGWWTNGFTPFLTWAWSQEILKPEDTSHYEPATSSHACQLVRHLLNCHAFDITWACVLCVAFKFSLRCFSDLYTRFLVSSFVSSFVYIGSDSNLGLKAREVFIGVFRISEYEMQGNCIMLQSFLFLLLACYPKYSSSFRSLKEFGRSFTHWWSIVVSRVMSPWFEVEFFLEVKQQSFLNYNYDNSVYISSVAELAPSNNTQC